MAIRVSDGEIPIGRRAGAFGTQEETRVFCSCGAAQSSSRRELCSIGLHGPPVSFGHFQQ